MKNSILFLVDHKHRDLASLSLIGYYLKKKGWNIFFYPMGFVDKKVEEINPSIIVLPKTSWDLLLALKWRNKNRKIIIIESEGNHQDLKIKARILIPLDYYIFWNNNMKDRYRNLLEARKIKYDVLGFYRSDFLHKSFSSIHGSKVDILNELGLNINNKSVTIATSSQDSHFSERRKQEKKKKRNRAFSDTASYEDIVKNMTILRDLTVDFVREFSKKNPNINIIIKPHPHENVVFWDNFISTISRPNVKLFVGKTINQLILISDFHIAYNVCTSTAEAAIFGLPTLEINTYMSDKLYDQVHLSLPKYRKKKIEDISGSILKEFSQDNNEHIINEEYSKKVNNYISEYFHIFDGLRCKAYANAIDNYWHNFLKGNIEKSIVPFYVVIISKIILLINFIKIIFFSKKIEENIKLINEVNKPSEQNIRKTKKIGTKIVDMEYGLFDNRIKPGDEQYWLSKFNNLSL
jgi:surface carbohydrate biosynthesis protein